MLRTPRFLKFSSVGLVQTRILRLSPGHATADTETRPVCAQVVILVVRALRLSAEVAVNECREKSDSFADFRRRHALKTLGPPAASSACTSSRTPAPVEAPKAERHRNLAADEPRQLVDEDEPPGPSPEKYRTVSGWFRIHLNLFRSARIPFPGKGTGRTPELWLPVRTRSVSRDLVAALSET